MKPLVVFYCRECAWDAYTDHHTRTELDVLTTEHALVTGHKIASVWIRRDRATSRLQVSNDLWRTDRSATNEN
ncbi:MAG TPA: hypothetical protein VFJ06_12915 [Halococcus sp.]|nr:hypothetical protein [Halococcus sp.]